MIGRWLLAFWFLLGGSHSFGCELSLLDYGAIPGDTGDVLQIESNTKIIQSAFRHQCQSDEDTLTIDGGNHRYAISGWIVMNRSARLVLRNTGFLQKAIGSSNTRTLFKNDGRPLVLDNIFVHRGTDQSSGHRNESAGIWVQVRDSVLRNVEITGDGSGQGLFVVESSNVLLENIDVHDMRWSADVLPEFETLIGIRLERSEGVQLRNSRVNSLLGHVSKGNLVTRQQSDGITVAGTRYLTIVNTTVKEVGEGIDLTGSLGNRFFEIRHSSVFDAHSFGFKFANTAVQGEIRDSVAYRSGMAGFVFSGKSGRTRESTQAIVGEPTRDILVLNCKAINTGHQSEWPIGSIAGFRVMQGLLDGQDGYPRNIRIVDSRAINDNDHRGLMRFGFHSETRGNYLQNVDSVGHVVAASRGFVRQYQKRIE